MTSISRAIALGAIAAAGCTHDFGAYEPVEGSDAALTSDTRGSDDTAVVVVDTGPPPCTPGALCIENAGTCANTCALQDSTCEAACKNPGCVGACRATEKTCKSKCEATCEACNTSQAGCPAASECTTATQ